MPKPASFEHMMIGHLIYG